MCDNMIIRIFNKEEKNQHPPSKRFLTQDIPDNLFYHNPKFIGQVKLITKQAIGKVKKNKKYIIIKCKHKNECEYK